MPCYLFTYHAYGTWMPDHPRGYMRRGEGVLPTDHAAAVLYRENAAREPVPLTADHQLACIAAVEEGVRHIDCQLGFVATDPTHIHVLISWESERSWQQNRTSLKRSVTIKMKSVFGNRPWLSEGSSRRRVCRQEHFHYLMTRYLPSHRGWKWSEKQGTFK